MIPSPNSHSAARRRTLHRLGALGLAVAVTGSGLFLSPAQAAAPLTGYDFVEVHAGFGDAMTISTNLLDNDTYDTSRTIQVTSVTQTRGDSVDFTWTPDGEITLDFGAFPYLPPQFQMREVGFGYTVEDSAGQTDNWGGATFIQRLDYTSAGETRHDMLIGDGGATVSGNIFANDQPVGGHEVEVISVTSQNGLPVTWSADGNIEVDMNSASAHEYQEFKYQIAHHEGGLSQGRFTVQRSLSATPPDAVDDVSRSVQTWWVDVIGNDQVANLASTDARATDVTLLSASATHRITGETIAITDPTFSLDEPVRTEYGVVDGYVGHRYEQRLNVDFGNEPANGPWSRTATVSYTLTDENGSDTATTTFTTAPPGQSSTDGYMYWQNGPKQFTFDPAAKFEAKYGEPMPNGVTVDSVTLDANGSPTTGVITDNGDGTYTHSFGAFPVTGKANSGGDDLSESVEMHFVDANGALVKIGFPVNYRDPADISTLTDDGEFWVAANGSVSIPLTANDLVGDQDWGHISSDPNVNGEGELVGTDYEGHGGTPRFVGFSGEEHGAFSSINSSRILYREPGTPVIRSGEGGVINNGALLAPIDYPWLQEDRNTEQFDYVAGDTAGTDTVTYTVCPDYPNAEANGLCRSADATIHVVPRINAQPDFDETDPDVPVTIPVLDNDLINDAPARAQVQVIAGTLPADVTAMVNADRTVTVTAPERYAGQKVQFEYNLIEPTLTSKARVTVTVSAPAVEPPVVEPPVVEPPVVEPPVVEPPVDEPPVDEPPVVGPDAKDDKANSVHSVPVVVSVLRNDAFQGDAEVRLVKGSVPDGVKASLDKQGNVTLIAPERLAGKKYSLRYSLTDKTGKTDIARVTVKVAAPILIVGGADREAPEVDKVLFNPLTGEMVPQKGTVDPTVADEGPHSTLWLLGGLLVALAGLRLGFGATTRRNEA